MNRVIAYVHDHLDEPLALDALAQIACLSPLHWHRIYLAMFGETLAQTVKRLRLHRAAGQLANSDLAISRIAAAARFPSAASFNRTFKSVYGMPPGRYRTHGRHRQFQQGGQADMGDGFDVSVCRLPVIDVFAREHRGSYMAIGGSFDLLFTRLAAAGLTRPGMRLFALFYDDPDVVAEADLSALAAVAGCPMDGADSELGRATIAEGDYAVLTHRGPYASMRAAYHWFFGEWLARSERELAEGPIVEEYLNSPREVSPKDLLTRICIPLIATPH